MVSPSRTIDVENRRALPAEGLQPNVLGMKNQNLLKPPSLPLGDVRNTLGAARQLFNNAVNEAAKPGKGSELKPLKPQTAPQPATETEILHEPDPVWDAPLAWEANVEDTYHDIIPIYLQLSDKAWDRLAWNVPGPRTGTPLSKEDDDVSNASITSFDEDALQDALDYYDRLNDSDDQMDVPPVDSDDEYDPNSITDPITHRLAVCDLN